LECAELRQIEVGGSLLGDDDVMKDLAEPRRDRPHLGAIESRRQLDRRQPLVDELPREVNVGPVAKGRHHLRQPELRDRPQLFESRHAAHRQLDRKGDLPFDLFGDERRGGRIDLHLHRRGVGKGVDVQRRQRDHSGGGHHHRSENDQDAVIQ
jgi:hypothetical protein